MKKCCHCLTDLPLSAFNKNVSTRDGLAKDCRSCTAEANRRYRSRHADSVNARARERYAATGGVPSKAYYEANKETIKARSRAWYEANRERANRSRVIHDREHPEGRAARQARYYEAHHERVKEAAKAWSRAHPEQARESSRRHQHLKRASAPITDVTLGTWRELVELWDNCCAYCGTTTKMTQDHVRPLTRGGLHLASNLLPACLRCNQSKGYRLLSEWPRYQRMLVS